MRKNISDFSLLHFIKPHILIASIDLFSQRLENCSDETHVVPLLVNQKTSKGTTCVSSLQFSKRWENKTIEAMRI